MTEAPTKQEGAFGAFKMTEAPAPSKPEGAFGAFKMT